MSRAIDLIITYRVVKMLVTPFNKFKAFDLGIIDEKGKVLRKFKEVKGSERKHYTMPVSYTHLTLPTRLSV